MKNRKKNISIVVSVFNEDENLELFWVELNEIMKTVDFSIEVVFVNDGSTDNSFEIIEQIQTKEKNVRIIQLSRNFGHEAAMLAGIDNCSGEAIICMDADLQHPPKKIIELVDLFGQGYEIVNMVNSRQKNSSKVKKIASSIFYSFINHISSEKLQKNATDFFLISRRVADVIKNEYRERTRFIRGFIQIVGFKRTTIEFSAEKRNSGKSKYSFFKLIFLSAGAIVSFTKIPLYLGLGFGVLCSSGACLVLIYSIIMKMINIVTPGYTTIVVLMSFLFATQFFLIGIIGIYIGYLFDESKGRPIYIIDKREGFYENEK